MKKFNYREYINNTWDNEVLGLVSQIHEYKGACQKSLALDEVNVEKLINIAKIQSTEASNKIEGIVTTATRIKQIIQDKTTPKNREECEIMGYRDVLNTIHENYEYISINSSYILQLHKDLYKYSAKAIGGKFKNVQNYISETRADGSTFVRFMPLSPFETPKAVEDLCLEFNLASSSYDIDALLLIPIFILDFLCIHAFNDGNGRMSRLLTILLLYKFGYNVGKYISIEKLIEETKGEYYEALRKSSENWHNNEENKNQPIHFIKYFLKILLRAYREFEERISLVKKNKQRAIDQVRGAIKNIYGKFTKSDIVNYCYQLSETSIERSLKQLLTLGEIEKHGDRKATYYVRKSI